MSRPELKPVTDSGLAGVGSIPFGLHLCSFYMDKRDLIDLLIPFFKSGLENRERCVWITAPPLPASEALTELRKVVPHVEDRIRKGDLRVVEAESWYQELAGVEVLQHWLKEEEKALADAYQGLRLAANMSFVKDEAWESFMEYERSVNESLGSRRIIALCGYDLRQCHATDIFEVTRTHQHSIFRGSRSWEVMGRGHGPLSHAPYS